MTQARMYRSAVETISITELHAGDELISSDGNGSLYVHKVRRSGDSVKVEVFRDGAHEYTLPATRTVSVSVERPCDCGGSGIYHWGGSVNGRPRNSGTHFACAGKGYQTRADVIRNITYWNKYARISY